METDPRRAALATITPHRAELPAIDSPGSCVASLLLCGFAMLCAAGITIAMVLQLPSTPATPGHVAGFLAGLLVTALGFGLAFAEALKRWRTGGESFVIDATGLRATNWRGNERRLDWSELRAIECGYVAIRRSYCGYQLTLEGRESFELRLPTRDPKRYEGVLASVLSFALAQAPEDLELTWWPYDFEDASPFDPAILAYAKRPE